MDTLANKLKQHAAAMDRQVGQVRIGLVESVDITTATVRVTIQPDETLTGWLPVPSVWIGAGWGMVCLPTPGQQVSVLSVEGDAEHGMVFAGLYSDTNRNPQAPVGEFWLVHQAGQVLKLTNDGHVLAGLGNGTFQRLATEDFVLNVFNNHVHPDPQGGNTGVPTTQVASNDTTNLTVQLKAT